MTTKYVTLDNETGMYYFGCPYEDCEIMIQVHISQVNCQIFRCGMWKHNGNPINPHTSKTECDKIREDKLIYGCSRPFLFKHGPPAYIEKCGYI